MSEEEEKQKFIAEEQARCLSLSYFAKKYLVIKDGHGNSVPLSDKDLYLIEMIEKAQKEGGELQIMHGRTGPYYAIVKA